MGQDMKVVHGNREAQLLGEEPEILPAYLVTNKLLSELSGFVHKFFVQSPRNPISETFQPRGNILGAQHGALSAVESCRVSWTCWNTDSYKDNSYA